MSTKQLFFLLGFMAFMLVQGPAIGQTTSALPVYTASQNTNNDEKPDVLSLLVNHTATYTENTENAANTAMIIDKLLQETNGQAESKIHKKFSRLLKRLHLTSALEQAQANHSLYLPLANLFSRIKLYPLAMKCYLKTIPVVPPGTGALNYQSMADTSDLPVDPLNFTTVDDSLYTAKMDWLEHHPNQKHQKAVNGDAITKAFNDGKEAIAYAMLFQVQQPVPGKNKVFKGIDAGHTFITLIKYNRDSGTVCRSFGFYPQKDNIFSGTPLCPTTASVFKNDEGHNWDILLGRFVSRAQFKKVLKLISKFEATEYKLSKNNCADFALQAAAIAGIYIGDTKAKWPLGYGNNPGKIGQSILQGNVNTANQATNTTPLYTYNTILSN